MSNFDMSWEEREALREEERKKKAKRLTTLIVMVVVALMALVLLAMCIEKIPRGYVGSTYSIQGGTSKEVLTEGWHIVSPMKRVTEYSVATEQLLLTKDDRDESKGNESFNATCKDGVLNVDLEMSYHFNAEDIPTIAKRYRGLSGEAIVDTRIKSKVKTYVNEVTSDYTILEAYMDKKSELNGDLTKHLAESLAPYGIVVESATLPRTEPDKSIKKAINSRSKKAQEIEAAKQELEKQKIEAETKRVKAEAEAKANEIISNSITPNLLKKMELEARMKHGWVTIQGAQAVVTK